MNKSNSSLARQVAEASSTFELQRTGRAPTAEVETTTGTLMQSFPDGTMVQVFLLAGRVAPESWSTETHRN